MIDNTLRIGVYGKVEQKKRLAGLFGNKGDEKSVLNESFRGTDNTTAKNKDESFSMVKNGTFAGPEDYERIKKEHAEMFEQLRKYKEVGIVPANQSACCNIF